MEITDNQMSVSSPKIFTTRNIEEQRLHMWRNSTFEDEINLCERRNIQDVFLKYLPKDEIILEALRDNPAGQSNQQTPIIILRNKNV